MKPGDLYEIRRGKPGGVPFIRIDHIDPNGSVFVTDWETPANRPSASQSASTTSCIPTCACSRARYAGTGHP